MKKEILRMDHIVVRNNGVPILDHFSMQIFEREIYGLLCLGRHGTEELLELICWNRPIQYGQVYFREKLVNSAEKGDGSRNRVTVISRQSRLIDSLSLADNLFVIRTGFKKYVIPKKTIQSQTQQLLDEMGIDLPPSQLVSEMCTFDRFTAELLRAMVSGEKLIVLYEVSDMLSGEELPEFHRLIRKFADKGFTFLYIYSHHEVLRLICDRIGIFTDGSMEKVYWDADAIRENIRVIAQYPYEKMSKLQPGEKQAERVKLRDLNLRHISLPLYQGEITLLLDWSNTVLNELMEEFERDKSSRTGLIQRDSIQSTLFPDMSYLDNLCFPLGEKLPFFWQRKRLRENVKREFKKELKEVLDAPQIYHLHSKELYTLVYYRFLISKPDLVVCFQPLSGLDMYLRTHILSLLAKLRDRGIAVLVLSTDLYDTLYIADRLIQVEHGEIIADTPRSQFGTVEVLKKELFPD